MDHRERSTSVPESAWHSTAEWQLSEGVWETQGGGKLQATFARASEVEVSLQVELGPDTELSLKLGFRHDLEANGELGSGMDGAYLFRCGQGRGERYTIERLGCAGGRLYGECWEPDAAVPGSHLVTCAARDGRLSLSVDDVEIISVRDSFPLTHLDAVCVAT